MGDKQVVTYLDEFCKDEDIVAVAAINAMMKFITYDCGGINTMTEMRKTLVEALEKIVAARESTVSVRSGCELFVRFITYTSLDFRNFEECRRKLIERGRVFVSRLKDSKSAIADHLLSMLSNKRTILLHGRSRVVLHALKQAVKCPAVRIRCLVTESRPDEAGRQMCDDLKATGIHCDVILDASIGYVMENVDLVLLGAEAVVASGGIINKIGTLPLAICAKAYGKPVYVLAESFKFQKDFPLGQSDLPQVVSGKGYVRQNSAITLDEHSGDEVHARNGVGLCKHLAIAHPRVDFTPARFLDLLLTDIGIVTPMAVSHELIKLYT